MPCSTFARSSSSSRLCQPSTGGARRAWRCSASVSFSRRASTDCHAACSVCSSQSLLVGTLVLTLPRGCSGALAESDQEHFRAATSRAFGPNHGALGVAFLHAGTRGLEVAAHE